MKPKLPYIFLTVSFLAAGCNSSKQPATSGMPNTKPSQSTESVVEKHSNNEDKTTKVTISEGWIEDARLRGWAYDDGKPLHLEFTFTSQEQPGKILSVAFNDSPAQTSEYIWNDRQDAQELLKNKYPSATNLSRPKEFTSGLKFPDGHYTLITATYNGKPFKFANGVKKDFIIKRNSVAACNPSGSSYIDPANLRVYENLRLGFRISLQVGWTITDGADQISFARQYQTCTQRFVIKKELQPPAQLPKGIDNHTITQGINYSEKLVDWKATDWTQHDVLAFPGLDTYFTINSNTYYFPLKTFVALGTNSPYSEGVIEKAGQGWFYDNDQIVPVQLTYQNLVTKNIHTISLASSNHVTTNRLDIIPYLKKQGVVAYAHRPGFQISIPDNFPAGQYILQSAQFGGKPMKILDTATTPFSISK